MLSRQAPRMESLCFTGSDSVILCGGLATLPLWWAFRSLFHRVIVKTVGDPPAEHPEPVLLQEAKCCIAAGSTPHDGSNLPWPS